MLDVEAYCFRPEYYKVCEPRIEYEEVDICRFVS